MTTPITRQELKDASSDAKTLEDVVNGAIDLNGDGVVTSRLGTDILTLSRLFSDVKGARLRVYSTKALLDADLAEPAGVVAIVTDDTAPENNTFYKKLGASGAGSWQLFDNGRRLQWQGAWSSSTTYEFYDLVENGGNSYLSLQSTNLNQSPSSSPAYWELVAQGGTVTDGSVTTVKLDNDAVTEDKLADGSVTTAKLAYSSVGAKSLYGLHYEVSSSDADHEIIIYPGKCYDYAGSDLMEISAPISKTITGNWAQGSGQGAIDAGLVYLDTYYHIFVISNGTTTDILFSPSPHNPIMPSGYIYKRWIGAFYTDANSNIRSFYVNEQRHHIFTTPIDILFNHSSNVLSKVYLKTPLGVSSDALLYTSAGDVNLTSFNSGFVLLRDVSVGFPPLNGSGALFRYNAQELRTETINIVTSNTGEVYLFDTNSTGRFSCVLYGFYVNAEKVV